MDETRQSLLLRAQAGEEDAWKDLTDLYRPLIIGWLNRQGVPASDLEDLSQDVLLSVVKHLPGFEHSGQPGRVPLLAAHHRLQPHGRLLAGASTRAPRPAAAARATAALQQIADPESDLNRQWDEEHDRYVLRCLLDMVEAEFEPATLRAFRRLALDGASGAEAAEELGLSVAAVYMAKSRVLSRIRQEAEGLID